MKLQMKMEDLFFVAECNPKLSPQKLILLPMLALTALPLHRALPPSPRAAAREVSTCAMSLWDGLQHPRLVTLATLSGFPCSPLQLLRPGLSERPAPTKELR